MHANMLARNSIVCMCWAECGCCLVLVCIFWFMFIAQCSVDQCSVFSVCLPHVATLYRFVNDDFYVIQLRHFSYLLLICSFLSFCHCYDEATCNGLRERTHARQPDQLWLPCSYVKICTQMGKSVVSFNSIVLGALFIWGAAWIVCAVDTGILSFEFNGLFRRLFFIVLEQPFLNVKCSFDLLWLEVK